MRGGAEIEFHFPISTAEPHFLSAGSEEKRPFVDELFFTVARRNDFHANLRSGGLADFSALRSPAGV